MQGNKFIIKTLLLIVFITLAESIGFAQNKHKIIDVEVLPYKSLSNGAFFKNLTLKTVPEHIEYIDGFDFEWGYRYKLKVKEITLQNPPMDGASVTYKLIKIISKTKASSDETFEMILERELYLGPGEQTSTFKHMNDSTYNYFDDINIFVKSELIEKFKQIINSDISLKGKFIIKSNGLIELIDLK